MRMNVYINPTEVGALAGSLSSNEQSAVLNGMAYELKKTCETNYFLEMQAAGIVQEMSEEALDFFEMFGEMIKLSRE